jgi:hypothetical protein
MVLGFAVLTQGTTPHPVPLPQGEGTLELPAARILAFPLQPNPPADLATPRGNLAKTRLRGEGQGEGRIPKLSALPGAAGLNWRQ